MGDWFASEWSHLKGYDETEVSKLDIVALLLKILSEGSIKDADKLRWADGFEQHHSQFKHWWAQRSISADRISRSDAEALRVLIEETGTDDETRLVGVRAAAEAFDDLTMPFMAAWFQMGPRDISAGDLVPVALPSRKDLEAVHRKLGPHPQNAYGLPPTTWLKHWVLVPKPPETMSGVSIKANRLPEECGAIFDEIGAETSVAIGLPSPFEFELTDTASTDPTKFSIVGPVPDAVPPQFFPVRPPATQKENLLRVLEAFSKEAAFLGLMPEFSLDEHLRQDVQQWFENRSIGARPALLGGGSLHMQDKDNHRRNRSITFLGPFRDPQSGRAKVEVIEQDKLFPMLFKRSADMSGLREAIADAGKTLTLHYAGRWSMATLVCKDFLDIDLVRWLALLRIRLVLVSATSQETDEFQTNARLLTEHGQSVVLVANAPWRPKEDFLHDDPASAPGASASQEESPQSVSRPGPVASGKGWWAGLRSSSTGAPDVIRLRREGDQALPFPAIATARVGGGPFDVRPSNPA